MSGRLKHQGTKTQETPRLILRRFTTEDAQPMFDNWASDPEVTKFLTWPAHSDPEITARVLKSWVEDYAKADSYQWAITLKTFGDEPIGSIGVVAFDEGTACAEIGYCIGRRWWHRGIMSEALSAVMGFLIGEVGVNRIQARHDVRNPHSGAVMRKCGMRYEGTFRQAGRNQQGICDVSQYAFLAGDDPEVEDFA